MKVIEVGLVSGDGILCDFEFFLKLLILYFQVGNFKIFLMKFFSQGDKLFLIVCNLLFEYVIFAVVLVEFGAEYLHLFLEVFDFLIMYELNWIEMSLIFMGKRRVLLFEKCYFLDHFFSVFLYFRYSKGIWIFLYLGCPRNSIRQKAVSFSLVVSEIYFIALIFL